jgi:hypothetical protein
MQYEIDLLKEQYEDLKSIEIEKIKAKYEKN